MGALSSHALPHLNEKDMLILCELEQDSRRSLDDIAERTGLSKQTLHYRIERLKGRGVIASFPTVIDAAKLGYADYGIWLQLDDISAEERKAFVDYLCAHGNVREAAACTGKYDIEARVLAGNLVQLDSLLGGMMKRFPGIVKNHHACATFREYRYPRMRLRESAAKRSPLLLGSEPKRIEIDEAGLGILAALAKNSRASVMELAEKAGVSPNTVRSKMERLETEGVIRKYTVLVQPDRVGSQSHKVLVSLQNATEKDEKGMEEHCRSDKRATFLRRVLGRWDAEIGLEVPDAGSLQAFLAGFRSRFSAVIRDFELVSVLHVHKMDYLPMEVI